MHMGLLIDGLLSLSRFGRQPLRSRSIEVAELVREVIESLADQKAGREMEILEAGPLPACEGDPILLRQVWINLISNAIKFSRLDSGTILIGAEDRDGHTAYFVKDNGVGFDMRYADKLFGVFQRLHRPRYEGTGIGLANVQRIVSRHGGRVWAEAVPDVGATFELPCDVAQGGIEWAEPRTFFSSRTIPVTSSS